MNFSSSSHSASDKYHTMKIYDIISEEELPGFLQPKLKGGTWTPPAAPVTPPPESPSTAAKVSGAVKGAAKSVKGAAKSVASNPLSKKIDRLVSSTPVFKAQAVSKLAKIGSAYLWFLRLFNMYDIAVGLHARWLVIDNLAAKGELTGTDVEAAKRVESEKAIVELTAAGTIAKIIMWVLRIITLGKLGSKVGGVVATVMTGGVLGAAAFAEIFLVEAASLAFQKWLETSEGQEAVAWLVINCMDPTAVWLYNLGFGRMTDEIKGLSKSGEAAYTKNITPSAAPASAAAGSDAERSATSDAGYMDKINQLIGKTGSAASGVASPFSANNFTDVSKLASIPV
jgi:hypothetical protein